MKILFYDTKNYDKESFQAILGNYQGITIEYTKSAPASIASLSAVPTSSILTIPFFMLSPRLA